MRNLSGWRVFLLAAPAVLLLFPVSVLVLILERISKSILYQHTYRDFRSGEFMITLTGRNSTASNTDSDVNMAMQIDSAPTLAILGVCLAAYIVCAIDAFGLWELKKVEGTSGHQRMWTWVAAVGNVLLAALSLGVFGWATAVQGSDGGWKSVDDVNKADREYTRETWACQIERYFPKEGWASGACGTAVGLCESVYGREDADIRTEGYEIPPNPHSHLLPPRSGEFLVPDSSTWWFEVALWRQGSLRRVRQRIRTSTRRPAWPICPRYNWPICARPVRTRSASMGTTTILCRTACSAVGTAASASDDGASNGASRAEVRCHG